MAVARRAKPRVVRLTALTAALALGGASAALADEGRGWLQSAGSGAATPYTAADAAAAARGGGLVETGSAAPAGERNEDDDLAEGLQREPLQEADPDEAWVDPNGAEQPRPEPGPEHHALPGEDPLAQERMLEQEELEPEAERPPADDERLGQLSAFVGEPVLSAEGEEIGEVEEIVRDPRDQSLQVVVATGGFLGIGVRRVVVPAQEFEPAPQGLQARSLGSQEELEQMGEYLPEQYEQVAEGDAGEGPVDGEGEADADADAD